MNRKTHRGYASTFLCHVLQLLHNQMLFNGSRNVKKHVKGQREDSLLSCERATTL